MKIVTTLIITLVPVFQANAEPWPKAEWKKTTPVAAGFNKRRFDDFVKKAFNQQLTFTTDSIVVVKDGLLVYEGYTNDYSRNQKHGLFSLGKTMINALVGVLETQGLMSRNDQARKYYPAIDSIGRKDITITQLMHMSSGIDWIEEDKENLLQSDPWFAFYSRASYKDMPAWIAQRSLSHQPDDKFNYSSGDSGLLVATLRGAIGETNYENYAWTNLFDKLGMSTVAIERDLSGNQSLHGIGYASALDVARLGLLYLNKGNVDGQQILPADWVDFTKQMAPSQKNAPDSKDRNLQNNQAYGAQIWLNVKRPSDSERPYPEIPENALLGLGTRGQILLILPDENLILVRMGTDTDPSLINRKEYRHQLFQAFYTALEE